MRSESLLATVAEVLKPTMKTFGQAERRTVHILILFFLAAGIVTAGALYYRHYERQHRAWVESQLSAIADLKVVELARYRQERLRDAGFLFRNASISTLVRRFLENPRDADAQRQLQVWIGKYEAGPQFDRISLLDTRGVERMSVPAGPAPVAAVVSQRASGILRSGLVTFQDFYRDEHNQRIYLAVLVPIFDEQNGRRPLGVMVLRIDPATFLYPLVSRWPIPSRTAETLLVRREGNDALFLNELRFRTNSALNLRIPLTSADNPAVNAVLGREGLAEGVGYRGVPVVAQVRRVPDAPWSLAACMDTSEVHAPLRARWWEIVGLAGVLLLGATGATGFVRRQQNMRFYRERYQAAEALRWSEKQLQVTLEATADGILTVDNRGKVLRVNRRFAELWRVPQSLLTSRDDQALLAFVLSQLSEPEAFLKKVQSLYGSAETDLDTLLFKDGRCFERYSSPMLMEGAVIGWVWVFRDITERRRINEILRNSETNYRALFTHSADGILIADLETKMFKYANPAICQLLGHTEDEFRTLNLSNISPKDELSHVVAEFEAQARGEKTLAAGLSVLRKDGTIIYADVNATTVTIDDRQCLVGFFRDVTERRRADDAAHREKNLNQAIVDSLPGIFYILDEHGHSLRWNRALREVSGYSDEDLPRMSVLDLFTEPDKSLVAERMQQVFSTGAAVVEGSLVAKDQTRTPYLFHGKRFQYDGTPCLIGLGTDITERKRAEKEMRSLARFPDENPNPVMRMAQDGKILYANAASAPILRLLGRQVGQNRPESWAARVGTVHASALPNDLEADAEGRVFSCMLTPIAGTGYVNLYGRDITARKAAEAELHRHGDSLEDLVKERTAALEANNAQLATEIMERRRTEQALQRSETQLEEAMELARLVNWEADVATGTFTFNDRFYALLGTTAQREGGYLMPAEVYSREFVHPQDAHLVAAEIAATVRATDPHFVSKMEHRIIRRDGEVRHIAVSVGTTRDATGRIVTTHGANQDITERKRAEEKLRILHRAVEQSPATVAITNAQGIIEYVNPKFVETTGYAREEAIGQNPRVLQSGTHPRAFYAELWSTIRAGNVWHGEFCNKKKNGELYFESAAIAPIRDERGQITHFVAIKEDITEQRRIADELRKAKDAAEAANLAKSDFLANMSHELRTPLSAIIGFSELLEERFFGDLNHKQEEYVGDILESGRHLLSLINDILDLAKVEAGKAALELSAFPLATLLDNSLVMVKEKCLKQGVALSMDIPESIRDLVISADERKLKQIMFNLLSNAAKFTPERGTITVSAKRDGNDVIVSVVDTGIGISKEHQEKVFSEFYQVAGGLKGKTPGTGLGLSLIKRMVELHGGRVWLESEGENKGSTFRFAIPLRGKGSTPTAQGAQAAPSVALLRVSDFVDRALAGTGRFCLCRVEPTDRMRSIAQDVVIQEFNQCKRGDDTVLVDTDGHFVLILTNAARAGAEAALRRLVARLEERLGMGWRRAVAVYPDDGQTGEALMEVLRQRCARSRRG